MEFPFAMSNSVSWLDDKHTVIIATLQGDVNYAEVKQQFDEIADLLDTVSHHVYVCHELTKIRRTSQVNLEHLTQTARHRVVTHPNRAFSYFIGAPRRAQIVVDLSTKIFPAAVKRFAFVHTLDEALQDIQSRSQHLVNE
ncbi:MAG: hypothetical protein SNJ54_14315 [Anaerolineae bacterium]